jgi:hypothetical protein
MPPADSPVSLLTLRQVRVYISRSGAIMMTAFFAIVYGLASMLLGGMIVLGSIRGGYTVEILNRAASWQPAWQYPGLLIVAPWGVVSLPWFPTLAMIVVSVGVGIGMSVAVLLSTALIRARRTAAGRPAAAGAVAGLTPAMISLVTLGACCSTTAAASAGVAVVAQVSGSTSATLILNNWYLGVFQVAVVWIALIAQELLLRVYGGLFGLPNVGSGAAGATPRLDRRFVAGCLLRIALLAGGVTWSLAMVADWTTVSPLQAPAATWFRWIFEHQLVSFLAMFAAFVPVGTYRNLVEVFRARFGWVARAGLLLGGVCLLAWVPPPAAGWGIEGFGNELAAVLGAPVSWGAVAPVYGPGIDLYLRWGLQYLLLSVFAVVVVVVPERAFRPLLWTVGHPSGEPETVGVGGLPDIPGHESSPHATASRTNPEMPTGSGGPAAARTGPP